jgi:hypothetical protein
MATIVYLDINTWIKGKLDADSVLTGLLGVGHVIYKYIQNATTGLPIVTYALESQNDTPSGFNDNHQHNIDAIVELGVWTDFKYNHIQICQAVDRIMKANGFSLLFAGDIPDSKINVKHEVLRYRRDGIAAAELT